jgi:hypothetical protein
MVHQNGSLPKNAVFGGKKLKKVYWFVVAPVKRVTSLIALKLP